MNDFDLPSSNEKQAFKFIIDSLKKGDPLDEEELDLEAAEERAPLEVELGAPEMESEELPALPQNKKYFRVGETAGLIGVEPHVLRYWESEFSNIRPMKSKKGHRVYTRKDVEIFQLVRKLLHVDKYSIKGAKKRLRQEQKEKKSEVESVQPQKEQLKVILEKTKELLETAKQPI